MRSLFDKSVDELDLLLGIGLQFVADYFLCHLHRKRRHEGAEVPEGTLLLGPYLILGVLQYLVGLGLSLCLGGFDDPLPLAASLLYEPVLLRAGLLKEFSLAFGQA